jgi:hypothetical protein
MLIVSTTRERLHKALLAGTLRIRQVPEMDDITAIATIVTTISVLIGVIFTILELRHLSRTRRTEIIMKIYDRFSSREVVEDINKVGNATFDNLQDYGKKYGFTEFLEVAVIFEGLGVLLEQKLIDIKMVDRLFGSTLVLLWAKLQPLVYGMRKNTNEPFFFSHYEYLINRLQEYRKKR